MEEVKRNDLLIFKNEVLEDIKNAELKFNEKLMILTKQFQNSDLINQQKFEYYKDKFEEILKQVDTTEFQYKINDKMDKYVKKMDDIIVNNNIKIQIMEKKLADSCYKYDEIYLKNMSSPGLIGDGCPYPTMKSFFNHLDKKIKELIKTKDKAFSDFNSLKSYIDKSFESFEKHIEKKAEEILEIILEKVKDNDKTMNNKMKALEDKFEHIRLDNGKYIYNIIKNQEIINEKLKFELKKYSVINETLFNFYNKQNKIQNSNNKEKNYKTLLNNKSTKRDLKKTSLNMNEIIPALQKMEENFNLNGDLYKNNDLKDLKLKIEDSHHFEIKRKETFNKNNIKENKSLFLRRSTLSDFNSNFKLYNHNFKSNLFLEDNIKSLSKNKSSNQKINKNNENSFKTEEEQKDIGEERYNQKLNNFTINTTKSEKKIFDKNKEDNFPLNHKKRSITFGNPELFKNKLHLSLKTENKDKTISQDTYIRPKINNNYLNLKIINEEKNEEIKNEIKETKEEIKYINEEIKEIKNIIKNLKDEKEKEKENKINETNEEKKSISEKENKDKEENVNKQTSNINNNNINYKNFSINFPEKENIENKRDEKIEIIYKYFEKKNEEVNENIDIIKKQMNYLIREISKIIKNKKLIKTHNILKFNNSISDNINLNNLYISNDSIVPLKYSDRPSKINEKSLSLDVSDTNNIKKNKRVLYITHNNSKNNNNYNDKENYCFLLNKIEPYLIKKFSNS